MKKAALRMRPRKAPSAASSSSQSNRKSSGKNMDDLLEMPNWEHPTPSINSLSSSSASRKLGRGDASTQSKGKLEQLLDGGDDSENDEDDRSDSYLQDKMVRESKSSARSKSSGASRGGGASLGQKSIALHLQDLESDDESTGVELFRTGKKSFMDDDDDGSISSASIECFKPKPSKQEMAKDVLRSFDQELRMEAEKSRNVDRYNHHGTSDSSAETPNPITATTAGATSPRYNRVRERFEISPQINQKPSVLQPTVAYQRNDTDDDCDDDCDDDNDDDDSGSIILSFAHSPTQPSRRHASHGQLPGMASSPLIRSPLASPVKHASTGVLHTHSPVPFVRKNHLSGSNGPSFFNDSLKCEELELNGSIDFGDIEPFTASANANGSGGHDDDNSLGAHSFHSTASVDLLSDQEKEDLEEKMVRIAMEQSLHGSSSMLDISVPASSPGHASFNASHGSMIDIGDDGSDEFESMAQDELEKEMLELAIQRSLSDSKRSDYTATTQPNTSDCGDSSGASGCAGQPSLARRQPTSPGRLPNSTSCPRNESYSSPYEANKSSARSRTGKGSSHALTTRSSSSHTGSSASSRGDDRRNSAGGSRRREDPEGRIGRHPSSDRMLARPEPKPNGMARPSRRAHRHNRPVQDI